MAKLADFRTDTKAIQDGKWVRVNVALYDDLEILSRGYVDEFVDAQNARLTKAAEPYQGDQNRIPNQERRRINGDLLREFLILGVRNLLDDKGEPVTLDAFLTMLGDPAYNRLTRASFEAAGRVTVETESQAKAAEGNSSRA